jgi:iron complex outermembrane receptor protein/outer membrane receptor for ferrienterochelin and colicins
MKYLSSFIFLFFILSSAKAQNSFKAIIKDKTSQELLSGVTVSIKGKDKTSVLSNPQGKVVIKNIVAGNIIVFDYVGYKTQELTIEANDTTTHSVLLEQDVKALNDVVVVSSTRGNDRIENATTKVEVLGLEEMNEESTLKPGNIASILGDVSGVQIQQSSITTGNANVRIQGLDGKYTQIIRDGMPLYGGYAGGFGILTIPPLDLKQIELIKGSASTLYGGGAIGGLINLVSKKPTFDPEASILFNQTTLKETNINVYYAQRWKKIGFTLFAGENLQKEVDVNNDGLSDMPNTKSTLIHPTLFFYPSTKSYVSLSWSGSFDNRIGGDMIALGDKPTSSHPYFEKNKMNRNMFSLINENKLSNTFTLNIKASISLFEREETTNTYIFNGSQNNFYTEASVVKKAGKHTIVGGINVTGDNFKPSAATPVPVGTITNTTAGVFVQDSWQLLQSTKLETGLRVDNHNKYGTFVLPRIALFHRFDEHWGSRLGFGMGYTTPNPLTPQIKDYNIYQLQPVASNVTAEKSYAGNIEFNYKKKIGEDGSLFINQAFFITQIDQPIIGTQDITGNVYFTNQNKPIVTAGFDTYAQLSLNAWELYLGYTYVNAERKYLAQNQFMVYTPRNRAAATVLYEVEHKFRIGIEASYNGYQYRDDNTKTPDYFFIAAMAEKKFGPKWSLVLNCENLLNVKQGNYESLYTGSIANPSFKTLWAPVDGRVANICLRFQPFAKAE